jgi:hypothetical protein
MLIYKYVYTYIYIYIYIYIHIHTCIQEVRRAGFWVGRLRDKATSENRKAMRTLVAAFR